MPSYSTLLRHAKQAKSDTERKKLLAKANALRRKLRNPPAPKTTAKEKRIRSRVDKLLTATEAGRQTKETTHPQAASLGWQAIDGASRGLPGLGERVGGQAKPAWVESVDLAYDRIAKHVRTNRHEAAKIGIRALVVDGMAGVRENNHTQRAQLARSMQEGFTECVVTGFIAQIKMVERLNSGLPPAVVVSGLELAKVVDVLMAAGWTEEGRSREMAKAASDVRFAT